MTNREALKRRIQSALPWIGTEAVINILYGFGMIAIVGRLIAPEEFGAASVALAAVYLIESFSQAGLREAVIRSPSSHSRITDVAHACSVALSVPAVALACVIALPLSLAIDSSSVLWLTIAASLGIPFRALDQVPLGILGRKMRVASITRRQIFSKIVGLTAAFSLALAGFEAWSLVLATLATACVSTINVWLMATRYPRCHWDSAIAKELLAFGWTISLELVLWNLASRAFTVLFGIYHGLEALGFFQFAYRLVDESVKLIRLIVSRLGLSAFASMARSSREIGDVLNKGMGLVNLISAPAFLGLTLLAPALVPLAFGDEWSDSTSYIQLLSIAWAVGMPRILISPALRATNRQNQQLIFAVFSAATVLICMIGFGEISPQAATLAFVSRHAVALPWAFWIVNHVFAIGLMQQLKALIPVYLAALTMAGCIALMQMQWPDLSYSVAATQIAIGGVVFASIVLVIDRPTVTRFLALIGLDSK